MAGPNSGNAGRAAGDRAAHRDGELEGRVHASQRHGAGAWVEADVGRAAACASRALEIVEAAACPRIAFVSFVPLRARIAGRAGLPLWPGRSGWALLVEDELRLEVGGAVLRLLGVNHPQD